jgi:tetratricopeptide (TPR) repeat protein
MRDKKSIHSDIEFNRVKTFMQSMNWFGLSLKEKKKYLKDKRLSSAEKTILSCTFKLRENKYLEIIETLESINPTNELVLSQKQYVMGISYNSLGDGLSAVKHLNVAIEILSKHELKTYEFNAIVQIFYAYLNLKDYSRLEGLIRRMQQLISRDEKEHISFLRCSFNFYVIKADFKNASNMLKKLDLLSSRMHPGQYVSHLVDKFIFFLKLDQLNKCEAILHELKDIRRYKITESFIFMQSLLKHILYDQPIYLYDKQFKHHPLLFYQLKVIQLISSGETKQAKEYWQKLHEMNSSIYSDFLEYRGDKCLFSICLEKHMENKTPIKLNSNLSLNIHEKKIIELLTQQILPVRKEDMYLYVWGKPINLKSDLNKLAVVIARLNAKTGLSIKSSKGSYFISSKIVDKKKSA